MSKEEDFIGTDASDCESEDNLIHQGNQESKESEPPLDLSNPLACWDLFRKTQSFSELLNKYRPEGLTEEMLKINFILYTIGLRLYNHSNVKTHYKNLKKTVLPNTIHTKNTQDKMAEILEKKIRETFLHVSSSFLGIGIYNKKSPARKLLKTFYKTIKDDVDSYCKSLCSKLSSVLRLKRELKRDILDQQIATWFDKWKSILIKNLDKLLDNGVRFPPVSGHNKTTIKLFKRQCVRYLINTGFDADPDSEPTISTVYEHLIEEWEDGTANWMDDLDKKLYNIIEDQYNTLTNLKEENIESDSDNSEHDNNIAEAEEYNPNAIVNDNWHIIHPTIVTIARSDDWFLYSLIQAENFSTPIWEMFRDYLTLKHKYQRKKVVAKFFSIKAICTSLSKALYEPPLLYSNLRGELRRRPQLDLSTPTAHLANTRLLQKSQEHTMKNEPDSGDNLRAFWVTPQANRPIEESLEISCNDSGQQSQSDLVLPLGSYHRKEKNKKEARSPSNKKQTADTITVTAKIKELMSPKYLNCNDATLAQYILSLYFEQTVTPAIARSQQKNIILFRLYSLCALLFGTEVRRNVMTMPTHFMMLQLIASNNMSWDEALSSFKKNQPTRQGGRMPMSMKEATGASRAIQSGFHHFFRSVGQIQYAGERKSAASTVELMKRHAVLTKRWKNKLLPKKKRDNWETELAMQLEKAYT